MALDYTGGKSNLHSRIAIRYFPYYFDIDQLYDIREDIWEQQNLADEENQQERLSEMKQTLEEFTQQFDKPFDMSVDPFYRTEKYQELVKNRIVGDKNKTWWRNGYTHRDKVYLLNGKFDGIQR